jgi:hypothetical protein
MKTPIHKLQTKFHKCTLNGNVVPFLHRATELVAVEQLLDLESKTRRRLTDNVGTN